MRNRGSSLIVVAILITLVGALCAAFQTTTLTFFRASSDSTEEELAVLAAQSGAACYLRYVSADANYFLGNPAPHAVQPLGDASFELESATQVGLGWKLTIVGRSGDATYRLGTSIGNPFVKIPEGLVVGGGGGGPSDVVFELRNGLMASYFPENGPFDPLTSGEVTKIGVNGSMNINSMSEIDGDVRLTGTVSGDSSGVSGNVYEGAPDEPIEDIDPYVKQLVADSAAANNNAALAAIFGGLWIPLSSSTQNYGDLFVNDGGTYVVPAGVYRFRRLEVSNGSTVIFDTSTGDAQLVYIGQGAGTGTRNDLTVENGSQVKVDPGGTDNNFLTVLSENSDFKVLTGSSYGQAIGDEHNAGYTQIISLGGDLNSDDVEASGGSTVYGRVYASAHTFTIEGGSTWYGSALVGEAVINDGILAIDLGTLGVTLEAQSSSTKLFGYWDE